MKQDTHTHQCRREAGTSLVTFHLPYQVKNGVQCVQLLAGYQRAAGVGAGVVDGVSAARLDGHHQEQTQGHCQEGGRGVVGNSPPAQGPSHLQRGEGLMDCFLSTDGYYRRGCILFMSEEQCTWQTLVIVVFVHSLHPTACYVALKHNPLDSPPRQPP